MMIFALVSSGRSDLASSSPTKEDRPGSPAAATVSTAADYGVDVTPRLTVVTTTEPAGRKAGVKVGSVAELVNKLKNEAGVI